MRVSEISPNTVKITLTDTEVLCSFSSYEKLFRMDSSAKAVIKALLCEIAEKYCKTSGCNKFSVRISAGKNRGCTMILTVGKAKKECNPLIFEFSNSESLIKAAVFLSAKIRPNTFENSLYKMPDNYRLVIKSRKTYKDFFIMNEFCDNIYTTETKLQFTEEYGEPLLLGNAVHTLSKAFKDF